LKEHTNRSPLIPINPHELIKRDQHMQNEIYACQTTPIYAERDVCVRKETCMYENRSKYVPYAERDLCVRNQTCMYENRSMYVPSTFYGTVHAYRKKKKKKKRCETRPTCFTTYICMYRSLFAHRGLFPHMVHTLIYFRTYTSLFAHRGLFPPLVSHQIM